MKTIITGHAGFIGSHFVDLLDNQEFQDAVFIDKGTYAANNEYLAISWRLVDIADPVKMDSIFRYHLPARVINFAAETHVDNSILDDRAFIDTNIIGTVNLLKLCHKYDVSHFHQISTDEVYGSVDSPVPEIHPYNPRNPYSASKAAADHFVGAYRNTYKVDATISRCGNNFGPRQHDEKFIPTVIRSILSARPIPVYGDGHNVREWLYVKDHVKMLAAFLHSPGNHSSINLGPGRPLSNIGMIHEIGNLMMTMYPGIVTDPPRIEFIADRKGHDRNYFLDCSKFKREYGLTRTPFHETMKDTIEYYYKRYMNK